MIIRNLYGFMAPDKGAGGADDVLDDDLFGDLKDEDDKGDGEPKPDGSAIPDGEGGKPKDADWFVPGKYKTEEDAKKGMKETERYAKRLEQELADMKRKGTAPKAPETPAGEEEIPAEEFIVNPKAAITKLLERELPKYIRPVQQAASGANWQVLKGQVQQMFPDFDIDSNQEVIAQYVQRYDPAYRQANGLSVLVEAIEKYGGKKRASTGGAQPPFSETGSTADVSAARGVDEAKSIRDGILKAKTSRDPLAGVF